MKKPSRAALLRRPIAAKSRTWVMQQQPLAADRGYYVYDLLRNGRQLAADLTEQEVLKRLRANVARNDRVLKEYLGGYRREITQTI